jgi:hypothetical protein
VADGLVQGERALRVYATDLGLVNAAVLAAAAWAACARRGTSVAPALAASGAAAAAGLALQLACLAAAAALLAGAGELPARRFLHVAPPALAAAVAGIGLELALRAGRRSA